MKIGTDGVLLGAMAEHPLPSQILDIGCGTGLAGLMLAQRFPTSGVDLIEIEEDAAGEVVENINASPFADRCRCFHTDVLNFDPDIQYDLIVSNPPYHLEKNQAPEYKRSLARSVDADLLAGILIKAKSLLKSNGILTMILPVDVYAKLDFIANKNNLWCFRKTTIHSFKDDQPVRVLAEWSDVFVSTAFKKLVIYNKDRSYTTTYKELTSDFYLNF